MVGCCNIGPCRKKRTYEFNNPGYEASSSKSGGTYRQSQLLEEGTEEATANGAAQSAELRDEIKDVVAVELDSNNPSEIGDEATKDETDGGKRRKDSKRSSKRSISSKRSSGKRTSKPSDKDGDAKDGRKDDVGVKTSVIHVSDTRSSVHDSDHGSAVGGAIPYPDGNDPDATTTTTTSATTYTSVIRHHVGDAAADGEGDDVKSDTSKRISNVSSSNESSHVISSTYDPREEGHFHSQHEYTVELTPGKSATTTTTTMTTSIASDDSLHYQDFNSGPKLQSSSVMVNVPTDSEELDNEANKLAEDLKKESLEEASNTYKDGYEDEEWTTVTEVTETVIHIDSPIEIGDIPKYYSP